MDYTPRRPHKASDGQHAKERILQTLMGWADAHGNVTATHDQIAEVAGCCRRQVIRKLKQLGGEGSVLRTCRRSGDERGNSYKVKAIAAVAKETQKRSVTPHPYIESTSLRPTPQSGDARGWRELALDKLDRVSDWTAFEALSIRRGVERALPAQVSSTTQRHVTGALIRKARRLGRRWTEGLLLWLWSLPDGGLALPARWGRTARAWCAYLVSECRRWARTELELLQTDRDRRRAEREWVEHQDQPSVVEMMAALRRGGATT